MGISIFSAIAAWIVIVQFEFGRAPASWLMLKLLHPGPWYFQMVVDLEYDGATIHFERVVQCKPKLVRHSFFRFSPAWYQGRYAVSEQLPDGSGVMIDLSPANSSRFG
jgi:hypothetical protein